MQIVGQSQAPDRQETFWLGPVNTNWAPQLINTNWVPGLVNTNWGPAPVNTN